MSSAPGEPVARVPMKDAADWHTAIAARFDSRYRDSPAFRERLAVWRRLIAHYADPAGDTLDAGCGSGVLAAVAAGHSRRVIGFDASPEMVRIAREKQVAGGLDNVEFRELRMEQLEALGDARFALVVSSSVLEYLEDFWGSVDALAGRLSPDGALIFSVQNMSSFYRQGERAVFRATGRPAYMAFVKSQPGDGEIRSGLVVRGLEVVETVYFSPAPLLSPLARPLGLARRADNLAAYVCRRGPTRPSGPTQYTGDDPR